ncbi:MAG: hypothetical protein AB1609_06305 [Bacillota bacterium]
MAFRSTHAGDTPDRRDEVLGALRARLPVAGLFFAVGLGLLAVGCCFGTAGAVVGLYGFCLSMVAGAAAARMVS